MVPQKLYKRQLLLTFRQSPVNDSFCPVVFPESFVCKLYARLRGNSQLPRLQDGVASMLLCTKLQLNFIPLKKNNVPVNVLNPV